MRLVAYGQVRSEKWTGTLDFIGDYYKKSDTYVHQLVAMNRMYYSGGWKYCISSEPCQSYICVVSTCLCRVSSVGYAGPDAAPVSFNCSMAPERTCFSNIKAVWTNIMYTVMAQFGYVDRQMKWYIYILHIIFILSIYSAGYDVLESSSS